jgi:hypothetical protein
MQFKDENLKKISPYSLHDEINLEEYKEAIAELGHRSKFRVKAHKQF